MFIDLFTFLSSIRGFPDASEGWKKAMVFNNQNITLHELHVHDDVRFRSDFSSVAAVRLRHNRAIYTRKNKTRLKKDANFPYKRHISSKIRRGLAKTRNMR